MATLTYLDCTITYSVEESCIILDNIDVPVHARGNGQAKAAMTEFMSKFEGHRVELHAYPQDDETDVNRLVSFYERFGFKVATGDDEDGYEMIRK
jgi:hypothetical protein